MLEVSGLHAGYGRIPVLRDIGLTLDPGEVVLVLGRNGAGKSTLLRTLAGFIAPQRGSIRFAGEEIGGLKPEIIARRGLRLVLDGHRVFPDLTVADNLRLGGVLNPDPGRVAALRDSVLGMFPILEQKLRSPARELSGGQQQMLALAQAFLAEPRALLCDEPSLGLAQALLPPILNFLKDWAARGTAVLIVEQQIDIALSVADRAIVIERGAITLAGPAAELARDSRLRDIYLGVSRTPS